MPGWCSVHEQFLSTFRQIPLYFADATGRWLVPDLRWFPDLDAVDPTPTAMLRRGRAAAGTGAVARAGGGPGGRDDGRCAVPDSRL